MPDSVASPPASSPRPGRYQHYKGNEYQVLGLASHSETDDWLVVYQALYGERRFWCRPLSIWNSEATLDGQAVTRFRLLQDDADRSLDSLAC